MKLFLVELQGMNYSVNGPIYGTSYVVASDTEEAYRLVRNNLDEWNIGYRDERKLKSITLIADSEQYGDSKHILFGVED